VGEVRVERVGQVAHREDDLVDTVRREPRDLAFEMRLVRDRQKRLRGRQRQRPEPGALTTDEDDRLHGFVVGVAFAGLLVAVDDLAVVGDCAVGTVGVAPAPAGTLSAPRAFARFGSDGGLPRLSIVLP